MPLATQSKDKLPVVGLDPNAVSCCVLKDKRHCRHNYESNLGIEKSHQKPFN